MGQTAKGPTSGSPRRDFMKTAAAVAAGAAVATRLGVLPKAYAAGTEEIKVGLIGSGQRGIGAARNALISSPNVKLIAMADVYADRMTESLNQIKKDAQAAPNVDVPAGNQFVGLDSYKQVLAMPDVNYVILATPPGFRSMHLRAAVEAGKHIFAEKPVCVDAPTARECFEVYDLANQKKLGIGVGTQRRHSKSYNEMIKRVQDGAVGNIVLGRASWLQGPIWVRKREKNWSDLEWMLRNWLYFAWLSGDFIVEQHVHNIDVINWAKGKHPIAAVSLAGRQVRVEPEFGHIYDHFSTEFEYDDGTFMLSQCRQLDGCYNDYGAEEIIGTKGRARNLYIKGENPWKFGANGEKDVDHYTQEHADLIASIRAGTPYNELKNITESAFSAVMARMSAYTGRRMKWEEALKSKEKLMPAVLNFNNKYPVPDVAMPGLTEFM